MKRILTVQDISCVGKCSLTVALPIISAAGVEAAVLPTAVLSTHTAFPEYTFRDLTDEMQPIADVFERLGLNFDALYTGYLGSPAQIDFIEKLIDRADKRMFVEIDPVMADNGLLYPGFTQEVADRMAKLCSKAALMSPNLTEASFMLHIPYRENYDEAYIRDVLVRLTDMGAGCAAITGVTLGKERIGVYAYHADTKEFFFYDNEKLPVSYHGTGDIFASATLGAVMRGKSVDDALHIAVDYTLACMKKTLIDENRRFYGVNFEEALPSYIRSVNE